MDKDSVTRRKYLNSTFGLAMLAALMLACTHSTTRTVTVGGLRFETPDGWQTTVNSSNSATVSSADGAQKVICSVLNGNSSELAVKDVDLEISKMIRSAEAVGKPTEDTRNGIQHYGKSGTGEAGGNAVAWRVDVFSAGKPVLFLTYAPANVFQKNSADYEKLISSINKE